MSDGGQRPSAPDGAEHDAVVQRRKEGDRAASVPWEQQPVTRSEFAREIGHLERRLVASVQEAIAPVAMDLARIVDLLRRDTQPPLDGDRERMRAERNAAIKEGLAELAQLDALAANRAARTDARVDGTHRRRTAWAGILMPIVIAISGLAGGAITSHCQHGRPEEQSSAAPHP